MERYPLCLAFQVAEAHRQSRAENMSELVAWRFIRDAYLAAGGDPATVATEPDRVIAVLCRMYPDWMDDRTK